MDSCTLLNHDSLNSSDKYSSTPPLRLWYVCVLFVSVIVHDCSWLPLWAGLGGSCFCNFKSFTSSTSTLQLFDSSTLRLFDSSTLRLIDSSNSLCLCVPFLLVAPRGGYVGWEFFCKSFISVSGLHIDSSTLRTLQTLYVCVGIFVNHFISFSDRLITALTTLFSFNSSTHQLLHVCCFLLQQ